jgi:hypothetical protein
MLACHNRALAFSVALSAGLHLVFLAGVAVALGFRVWESLVRTPSSAKLTSPLLETVWLEPAVPPEVPPRPEAQYVRTDASEAVEQAPSATRFHSDHNTQAGSSLPPDASGAPDLGSQEGLDVAVIEVTRRELIEGELLDAAPGEPTPPQPVAAASLESTEETSLQPPSEPEPVLTPPAEPPPAPPPEVAIGPAQDPVPPEPKPEPRDSPPKLESPPVASNTPPERPAVPPASSTRPPAKERPPAPSRGNGFQGHTVPT